MLRGKCRDLEQGDRHGAGTSQSHVVAGTKKSSFATGDFRLALAASILTCTAFAPVGLWPIIFVAPIGWIRLVFPPELPCRHRLASHYVIGFLYWMLLIQWIRLPHWSAYFGWIALAAYLAIYFPVFMGTARVLVHRWRIPAVIAVPATWTGCEVLRSYLFTGFPMSLLSHAVVEVEHLTQIADLVGAYGVSFVIMTIAAALAVIVHGCFGAVGEKLPWTKRIAPWQSAWCIAVVVATLSYGSVRLGQLDDTGGDGQSVQVALIQGVYDTEFDSDPENAQRRAVRAFQDYLRLSQRAVAQRADIDLIVWPESMFSGGRPYIIFEGKVRPPTGAQISEDQWMQWLVSQKAETEFKFERVATLLNSHLLVGMGRMHATEDGERRFNSAMFIDPSGRIVSTYDKMHPVMFGEYVPLGRTFPWLYRLTPMGEGLTAGTDPISITIDDLRFSPCICFENTVPHLLRQQVRTLAANGEEPDCMITITNDGWFWGSSLLDAHLACGIFRAIELRKPMLIAANTGFSAWIDCTGRVRAKALRRKEDVIFASVAKSNASSVYLSWGDFPGWVCAGVTVAALVSGLRIPKRS